MVDVYGCAAKYERRKREIKDWLIAVENRAHLKRYVRNCLDHLSPGRRYTDIWLLKKLFVGVRLRVADRAKERALLAEWRQAESEIPHTAR